MVDFEYRKLRGRIVEKYGTQDAFAKALGLSKNALSRKMTCKTMFSQNDIEKCCSLLEIEKPKLANISFHSTVGDRL